MAKIKSSNKDLRKSLGLNQQQFWSRIGVTQSGGSRYENGRAMPKPVQELLRLAYIEGLNLNRLNKRHLKSVGAYDHVRA